MAQGENTAETTQIIKTLWSLMDEPGEHFAVVSQLKKFDTYVPKVFSDVLISALKNPDREIKYRAVKRFSIFWRVAVKDKDYRPFLTQEERMLLKSGNEIELEELQDIFGELDKRENSYVAPEENKEKEIKERS